MDKELAQEFKKIDERFEKIDQRFDAIISNMATKFEMKDGFATLRAELADKADIDRVYTAVDTVAKDYIQYSQELAALKYRFDQMHEFNKEVAGKLGLKYEV